LKSNSFKFSFIHPILTLLVATLFFNPFNIGKFVLPVVLVYMVFQIKDRKFLMLVFGNAQFWLLLLFSVLYVFMLMQYQFIEINTGLNYLLYFILLYAFGLTVVMKAKNERQIIYYLYAIIIGLSLFGIAAVIYSNLFYGISADLAVRRATIPWMRDVQLGATGIGMFVSLGIALLGLVFVKSKIMIKGINALIALLSIFASITLANRTGLLIALISVFVIYVAQARLNSLRNNIKIAAGFIVQLTVLFILFNINFLNVKSFWLQSHAYNRVVNMSLVYEPRFIVWGEAIQGIFTNPLGGKETELSLLYAHNLWLDVGYSAGAVPFIIVVIFTLMTLNCYARLIQKDTISRYFKYLVTTMICGFILTFMLEPVIEGNYLLFGAFCMVSGILKAIDRKMKYDTRISQINT